MQCMEKQQKTIYGVAEGSACAWFAQKGWEDGCFVFWCAGIWGGDKCSFLRGKTSSFSLGKKKQKPERHARSGKSRESPHFRSGRARSRDVGCFGDGSRPACAFPLRKGERSEPRCEDSPKGSTAPKSKPGQRTGLGRKKWASGFACTPLRRRSALAGAWLRGRDDCHATAEISCIPPGQAESCPCGGYCQPRGRRLLELLL